MTPPGTEPRAINRWRIAAILAGFAALFLMGYVWHLIQPWVRANASAREVEKTGAEVRRIVWSPVYLVFRGPEAASQLEAASPHFQQLFTVTYIIFEDAEVTPEMIPHFHKLQSLQVLGLARTEISKETMEQLRREFPNLVLVKH